jgi:hypothetical protein
MNPIGDGVFAMENPLHRESDVAKRAPTFTPLTPEELPGRAQIVALDAEFVRVASEGTFSLPYSECSAVDLTYINLSFSLTFPFPRIRPDPRRSPSRPEAGAVFPGESLGDPRLGQ